MGSMRGKRAVIVRSGEILLVNGLKARALATLAEIALPDCGDEIRQVENILAAVRCVGAWHRA